MAKKRAPAKEKEAPSTWRSRILGEAEVDPKTLTANPLNWRTHPQVQKDAIGAALDTIGWIQRVIVNKKSGRIVDGHARVQMAIDKGEATVPVSYVELTDNEERAALATFDPLSQMAVADASVLFSTVDGLTTGNDLFDRFLGEQRETAEQATLSQAIPSEIRNTIDRRQVIRLVLPVNNLNLFEEAVQASGQHSRADALEAICRGYLYAKSKGQLDGRDQNNAAAFDPSEDQATRAARDARRVREAV